MLFSQISFLVLSVCFFGDLDAHPYGYVRPRPYPSPQCYSSGTDLETLLQLAKFIGENKEVQQDYARGLNVDEIVSKLLNALIYTCTQNHAHVHGSYRSGGRGSDGGLINLDLLRPGKNNVAELDIGGQEILGVGIGGGRRGKNRKYKDGKYEDNKYKDGKYEDYKYKDGKYEDGKYEDGKYEDGKYKDGEKQSGEPLIGVNLLQPGKNNVAEVDLAGRDILGVGLGGEQE